MNFALSRNRSGSCRLAPFHSREHGNEEKIGRKDREAMDSGDERQGEEEGPTHRRRLYHEWAGDVRLKIARVKQLVQ